MARTWSGDAATSSDPIGSDQSSGGDALARPLESIMVRRARAVVAQAASDIASDSA
jgi:hypothetical protein